MKRFAVLTFVLILATSTVWAGTYYKIRNVVYDLKETGSITEIWVDGDQGKIQTDSPPYGPRVWITNDGGRTAYLINQSEKTYSKYDIQGSINAIPRLISGMGPGMSISFTDQKSEILEKEPGPEILGMPTTHIRSRTSYAMSINVIGIARTSRVEVISDYWVTGAVKPATLFFEKLIVPDMSSINGAGSSELNTLLKEGLVLKSESNQTTSQFNKNGKVTRTKSLRSTMEITELDVDFDIPEGTFEIPSEYTLVESHPDASEDNPLKGIFNRR